MGKTDPLNTPVDQDLSELTSRHSVGLLASQRLAKDWDLSLNYYHQSATGFFDGSAIDSYQRLDTRLAKSFRQGNTETKIALVVQNLLDEGYAEYQLRNQFDRRAYLSLTLHFL